MRKTEDRATGDCTGSVFADEHTRHPHPRANTHTCDKDPATRLLCDIETCRDLPCTGWKQRAPRQSLRKVCADRKLRTATQRVPDGDGTTVHVDLLERNTDSLDRVHCLAGKCLVDLKEVHVFLSQPGLLENLRDGVGWANAHDPGRHAHNGGTDELADDGQTETLGHAASGEQDCRGTVGDLRGGP